MENDLNRKEAESFRDKLQRDALEAAVKATQEKIAALVCPAHQQSPRLKFSEGSGLGQEKMSFDCCCDKLAQMLQETLQS